MTNLAAQLLSADPRVADAKRLLLQAMEDHSRHITGIRPPDPAKVADYEKAIQQFGEMRGGALYYPYLGSGIGRGPFVELADGSVKYDMISGIGVHCLGHSHPALLAAGIDASLRDTIMQGNLQQNVESIALSNKLIDLAAAGGTKRLTHCFLTTSGAMANENALKLMFQARAPAQRVLAFSGAFAGRTIALSQITDKAAYRAGLPTAMAVDYIPFFDAKRRAESIAASLSILQNHLDRFPGQHAAMCFELVQGEGGYYAGEHDFFIALIDKLKTRNVAIWIDEIQTFGRTTQPFALQHFGLDEHVDVVTVGKLTQACATLFTEAYKPKPGLISQTFTASTSAIFAANAILDLLTTGEYFGTHGKIQKLHDRFAGRLSEISKRNPELLAGPFGIGGMIACSVFGGAEEPTKKFLRALFDAGVIAFVAGAHPARVRFLVPFGATSETDIDAVCDIVEMTLTKMG